MAGVWESLLLMLHFAVVYNIAVYDTVSEGRAKCVVGLSDLPRHSRLLQPHQAMGTL